jgi:hypothetical protein
VITPGSTEVLTPAGAILVPGDRTEFLNSSLQVLTGGNLPRWEQLRNIADGFTKGYWSDGTRSGETQYTPGNGQDRLKAFLATLPSYVGSDEQYAAAFALAANRIGFPARVVFGAHMPASGTVITGKDVTIWVEVRTVDGWVGIPPDFFIPPRDKAPIDLPPPPNPAPVEMEDIAQGHPKLPPEDMTGLDTQAQTGRPPTTQESGGMQWWQQTLAWSAVVISGLVLVVGLLLFAKSIRSWSRQHRGSYAQQIAGGWADAIDQARDLGMRIPKRMTRAEVASVLALAPLTNLATHADRAMFQSFPPNHEIAQAYWQEVTQTKTTLVGDKMGLARLWARINPRSLVPLLRQRG